MATKEEKRMTMTDGGLLASCLSEAMGDWVDTYSDKEIHAMHNAMKLYADAVDKRKNVSSVHPLFEQILSPFTNKKTD